MFAFLRVLAFFMEPRARGALDLFLARSRGAGLVLAAVVEGNALGLFGRRFSNSVSIRTTRIYSRGRGRIRLRTAAVPAENERENLFEQNAQPSDRHFTQ